MLPTPGGPPLGHALFLARENLQTFSGPSEMQSSLDVPRFQKFQKHFKDTPTMLLLTKNLKDSHPNHILKCG